MNLFSRKPIDEKDAATDALDEVLRIEHYMLNELVKIWLLGKYTFGESQQQLKTANIAKYNNERFII